MKLGALALSLGLVGGAAMARADPKPAFRIELSSPDPEVGFHRRVETTRVYRPKAEQLYLDLCDVPCTLELPAGTYSLALSKEGGKVVPAGAVSVEGPSTIDGQYLSRQGARTAGRVVLAIGLLGGLALSSWGLIEAGSAVEFEAPAQLWIGLGVAGAGLLVGVPLIVQKDEASVTITRRGSTARPSPGLSWVGRF